MGQANFPKGAKKAEKLPLASWAITPFLCTGRSLLEVLQLRPIVSSCPWLLSPLCSAELHTQRAKVLTNLQNTVFTTV